MMFPDFPKKVSARNYKRPRKLCLIHTSIIFISIFITISLVACSECGDEENKEDDSIQESEESSGFYATADKYSLIVDEEGDIIISGMGLGLQRISTTNNYHVTIKYNSNGDKIWWRAFQSDGFSYHLPIASLIDDLGNIYFSFNVCMNKEIIADYVYSCNDMPIKIVKYDKNYDKNGEYTVISNVHLEPYFDNWDVLALIVYEDGTIYSFAVGGFLFSYDSSGNLLKVEENVLSAIDDLVMDEKGNIYITRSNHTSKYDIQLNPIWEKQSLAYVYDANYPSHLHYLNSEEIFHVSSTHNNEEEKFCVMVQYDQEGNEIWSQIRENCQATSSAIDESDNIYVTADEEQHTSLVKYDTDGNLLWESTYFPPDNITNTARDLEVDQNGKIYVAGWYCTRVENTYYGVYDFMLIKHDVNGDELWARHYNSTADPLHDNDRAFELELDANGDIYVLGDSGNDYREEYFVLIKYNPDGNELWTRKYEIPD